jgi:glycine cleavage system T protein (aminomethyltransferase)
LEKRSEKVKQTPLFSVHQRLGAKMVPFGGFEMPVQYSGIIEEHKKVRTAVGIFDVSHMGEFVVKGKEALSFLQCVTINDVAKMRPGRVQYSAMCNDDGGIIDDLLIYQLNDSEYMVVVNASNIEKDFQWLSEHRPADAELQDDSEKTCLLAIQGPKSEMTLQKLTSANLSELNYYNFIYADVAGYRMIVSRTGYTGEPGFEIYFPSSYAESVWNAVLDAGKEFGIAPVGLGARDILRMEMGYCLYGSDIDTTTNPLEAGLGRIAKMTKGNFIGRTVLEKIKADGVTRKFVGMVLDKRAVPRHGYLVYVDAAPVGTVTSGTFSPSLEKGIALGYVAAPYADAGKNVFVDIRGTHHEAKVVPLPFLQK